jgi:hypothetical protein
MSQLYSDFNIRVTDYFYYHNNMLYISYSETYTVCQIYLSWNWNGTEISDPPSILHR